MDPCLKVSNKRQPGGTPVAAFCKDAEGLVLYSPAGSNMNDSDGTQVYRGVFSDCASTVSSTTPMSIREFTLRDENWSFSSNSFLPHNFTSVDKAAGGNMEPVRKGSQRQKQPKLTFTSTQVFGSPTVLTVGELHNINFHQTKQSQQPEIFYPLSEQYTSSTQNEARTLLKKQEMFSRNNSCGDSLMPSYVSLDKSSDAESPDLPPEFNLHKNQVAIPFPNRMSCSICPRPDKSVMPKTTDMPSKVPNVSKQSLEQRKNAESVSITRKQVVEKNILRGVEDAKTGRGNSYCYPYKHKFDPNLLITWPGSKGELAEKLSPDMLEVQHVFKTRDKKVGHIIFENHSIPRRAFKMHRGTHLRMVRPWNSLSRNPSPMFLVKFETKPRMAIKKEREECNYIIGNSLMSDCQKKNICMIWVDKLNGHLLGAVYYEGKFIYPVGKIVDMKISRVLNSVPG